MLSETVRYDPRDGFPFVLLANRYWLTTAACGTGNDSKFTLIFLHSTSFHKETWEPCIERLLNVASTNVREAWSFECPNHGESAVLNAKALNSSLQFSCKKYAECAYHFFSAGPEHGARIDFSKRNLVGVGHSLGSVAMTILSQTSPRLPFSALFIVDPVMTPLPSSRLDNLRSILVKTAYERRDVFPNRKEAREYFAHRDRVSRWDSRILEVYVKHAIVKHPGSMFPEAPYFGVALACSRDQEAAMYRDVEGATKFVSDLAAVAGRIPVHVIYGAISDFLPREAQDALTNLIPFATLTRVRSVGHLVPQEAPDKLADLIAGKLPNMTRSKL